MHERFMTEITIDAYAPFTYCILWESESGPINLRVAWINWTMCSSYTGSVSIQFKLHFSSKIKQSFGSDTWHVTFTFIYVVSSCISMCTQAAHAICIYIRLECLSDIVWIGSKYCHRQTNSFDIHCQSCSNHRNSTEFWVETFNHWWQLLTFATHVFVTRMNGINILKIVNIDRQSREFFFRALLICSQRKFDVIDECHQYILSNMQKQIIVWCMSTYPFHHGVCCGPPKPGNPKPNALKNGSVKNGVLWNGVLWNGVNGVSWMTTESSSELSGAAASCPCMWTSTSCGPLPSVPLIASTIWICWCAKSKQTMIELAVNGI